MKADPLHIAMLSIHSSPLGELGARDTGGMSVYIRELAGELGRSGHRVDIFTRKPDRPAPAVVQLLPGVRLVHLAGGANGGHRRSALYPHLPRFFEALDQFRVSERICYDVVHSHYWLSARVGTWAQKLWGVPHVVMFHTLGAVKNRLRCGEEEPELRVREEADAARACDRIVAPTLKERDHLAAYCGAPASKLALIPCGVNLSSFQPVDRRAARESLGLDPEGAILLYVGRFSPLKGLDRLLEAVALLGRHPGLRLVIAGGDGTGSAREEALRSKARELGIAGRVAFVGRVDHLGLPPYYSAADALVLPSLYESFGLVALEALACGTPVVATRVGAMEEILTDPWCGVLVSSPEPEALARGVDQVLEQRSAAPLVRERIRAGVSSYTWARVATAVAHLYEALAGVGESPEGDECLLRTAAAR